MRKYKVLWKIPYLSQDFVGGPDVKRDGSQLTITCYYPMCFYREIFSEDGKRVISVEHDPDKPDDSENDDDGRHSIIFNRYSIYNFTKDIEGIPLEVFDADQKVIEILDSSWVHEFSNCLKNTYPNTNRLEIHHYRIFFEDGGLFDIAAESFSLGEFERIKRRNL